MKIVLKNGRELEVKSLIENYNKELDIIFGESVTYEEVRSLYDPYNNPKYSTDVLDRFEVYSDNGEIQGTHYNYIEPVGIRAFNGELKVTLKQEAEHERIAKTTQKTVSVATEDNLINMDLLISIDDKLTAIAEHLKLEI